MRPGTLPVPLIVGFGGVKRRHSEYIFAGMAAIDGEGDSGSRESKRNQFSNMQRCEKQWLKRHGWLKPELILGVGMSVSRSIEQH
jgi:hypothetical protein